MKINDLNDDCLFEVFNWLSLAEKCGVQRVSRRWQRMTNDMISVQDSLELYQIDNKAFFDRRFAHIKKTGFSFNAFYSYALKEFYETNVLGDEIKSFFSKFDCKTNPNNDSEFFVANIKHLEINNWYFQRALNESTLLQLLTIFRNLKSIKFDWVDLKGEKEKRLGKCAENLESIVCHRGLSGAEIMNLIESCKQLRILDVPNKSIKIESQWFQINKGLRSLEQLCLTVSDTGSLQSVLSALPKLTKIKASYSLEHNDPNSFDSFWRLFPAFAMRQSLKGVDVSYCGRYSGCGKLRLTSDCLEHLESLTLRRVTITSGDMRVIAKQFPALSKLALLYFSFVFLNEEGKVCYLGHEENDTISFDFLEAISSLSKLRSLFLKFSRNRCKTSLEAPDKEMLLAFFEKLPNLRRLSCNCFDIDDCFKAFCRLASNKPKQSFAFKDFKDIYPFWGLSEEAKKCKPRNVCLFTKRN